MKLQKFSVKKKVYINISIYELYVVNQIFTTGTKKNIYYLVFEPGQRCPCQCCDY